MSTSSFLQVTQRLLITAVAVVLALLVGTTFMRIVRPPDAEALRRAELAAATTTTLAVDALPDLLTTTTSSTTLAPAGDDTATTTTASTTDDDACPEPTFPGGSGTVLQVFYNCGASVVPIATTYVYRTVATTPSVLTRTLAEMVKGPTREERELGYDSLFSSATTNSFLGVELSGGKATVNFTGLGGIDGISVPERSVFFLADINATVFQFDTVTAAEYRLDGSCDAFWALFGGECQTISRADWTRQISEWRGR